jgi:hypothetical protein
VTIAPTVLAAAAAVTGVTRAFVYLRQRRWTDAALATVAGAALALLLVSPMLGTDQQGEVVLDTETGTSAAADEQLANALLQLPLASTLRLQGHGLREAQWRDLPARPLQWQEAPSDMLWLDFPRTLALGRNFSLTVRRAQAQPGWRLQLLAENDQLLAEAHADQAAPALTVQWQPPLAETLLLKARLLDSAGRTVAQGPLPLRVEPAVALQLVGRFGAPSFDVRALNQLLTDSGAIVDWQTTLGKSLARSETSTAPLAAANAIIADAAYVEQGSDRAALLAQVGRGTPLLILGGNAQDSAQWQRTMGLKLVPQSATTELEDTRHFALAGGTLAMPAAPFNPAPGVWQVLAKDKDGKPWLWQRDWQQGRIVWLGVADWHRAAINAPMALSQWWQQVLDLSALGSKQPLQWLAGEPMALPGLRAEFCARGATPGASMQIADAPPQPWQTRSDQADAACVAVWPQRAGWLTLRSGEAMTQRYVFGRDDWPAWQQALRHDATARYAMRSAPAMTSAASPAATVIPAVPRWLAGLVLAVALLALWWREQYLDLRQV